MDRLRIALAQFNGTVGDFTGNSARITEYIEEARHGGAQLVVFPQFALEGWPAGDLLRREAFLAAARAAHAGMAERTRGLTAVVGCVESFPLHETVRLGANRPGATPRPVPPSHNAAMIMQDGTTIGTVGKERLGAGGKLADESRYFQPGAASRPITVAGWRVGVVIGSDIEPETGILERLVHRGVDLIVNLDAAPFQQGAAPLREERLARLARRYGVFIAYVNRVGGQDEFVFDGGSMVITPSGEVIARAAAFDDDIVFCDLPAPGVPAENMPAPVPASYDDLGATYRALTVGIRDYVRKNGFSHVVLGLSGGIDSALVAALAVDALGPNAVTGVWLPSPYSSELSRDYARDVAASLGIELITLPVEPAYQALLSVLEPYFEGRDFDLTEENLQARVRGTLLMALSNKFGWLVLATGNKSEAAAGYCTLYGDTVGGLAPIKDLYKTKVFELARWRNRQGKVVIPEGVIQRAPTAELRHGQLDTDSLPPYDVLDQILQKYLEEGYSASEIVAEGAEPEVVAKVIALVDGGEYKRRQGAAGIKLTSYTFGVDDQLPLTSRFREG